MGQVLKVFFAVRSPKLNIGLEVRLKGIMSKYIPWEKGLPTPLPFLMLVRTCDGVG